MRTKRQYKRILCILCFLLLVSGVAIYAEPEISVYVDGTKIVSDTPAIIVDGRTMLPFRSILNALGVDNESITWDAGSRSIEIHHNNKYIFLMIGNTDFLILDLKNELPVKNPDPMDVAPFIRDGRTLVPVRFISKALDATVNWDPVTKTVYITR
ncbi:MAG: copper amine oxidase N-terminal domain-containing protein [Eubacteriales bacterium]|nr:copper amine oxidase N-terminal domain-containing protein [Eubacteriales bacterium]